MGAYEKLPPDERARIDRMAKKLIENLRAMRIERGSNTALGMGENGAIELLGKLGIWALQNPEIVYYN